MFRRALRAFAAKQTPHGGKLLENLIKDKQHQRELIKSCDGRILRLNERQSCDVELLTNGGFSPLKGFMNEDAYNGCVKDMRLPDSKLLWGIPVVLDCDGTPNPGERWLLQWGETPLGVIDIESKWRPQKEVEAKHCYRVTTIEHPGVRMISMERGPYYVGGTVTGLEGAQRVFPCSSPAELRASLPGGDVVAFQCRNPIHRAHFELFMRALEAPNVDREGVVLVHPTVGPTQEDDIPGDVRYHTYEALKQQLATDPKYQEQNKRVRWGYLPYSMHMAGPREAIQHMIIRKNFGCTHFIIGRDMAGSKSSITGDDFYGAYDAQDFAKEHAPELGMQTVPSLNLVYTDEAGFVEDELVKSQGYHVKKLSGTEFRRKLRAGEEIPEWFAFPSVVNVLRQHVKTA